MSEKFSVEIITPNNSILKTEALEVILPCYEGEIGILKDHIPIITFLRPGIIKIQSDSKKNFYVEEGTVEFSKNSLLILTSTAILVSKLNTKTLEALIEESEKKLNDESINDKEKYLMFYKIQTLKQIIQ